MTRRNVRQERKAAQERDWAWQQERDSDHAREELPENDEHAADEYRTLAKEFRG